MVENWKRGRCLRIPRGINLKCVAGSIWITWKGSGDYLLKAGDIVVPGPGAVAQALKDSTVEFPATSRTGIPTKNRRQIPAVTVIRCS